MTANKHLPLLLCTALIVAVMGAGFYSTSSKAAPSPITETATTMILQTSTSYITSTAVTTSLSFVTRTETDTSTSMLTVANTTITKTTTSTLTSYSTGFPSLVTVSGAVTLNSLLNAYSPTTIQFVANNTIKSATIANGKYSITLTDGLNYIVTVNYSFLVSTGSCVAGNLPLNALGPITENWSC